MNGNFSTFVPRDASTYNKLNNDRSALFIEFLTFDNNFYYQMSIDIASLDKHDIFKIKNIEFHFEDKTKTLKINKIYRIDQDLRKYIVKDNPDMQTDAYFSYIFYANNNIKIDLQKIFNKNISDVGKTLDVDVVVLYSFDEKENLIQKLKYKVSISEGWNVGPAWIHKLFPGM